MPYKRKGRCVYVLKGGKWVLKGCSETPTKAKKYLRKLHMVSGH